MAFVINATYDTSVTSLQNSDPTLYTEYTGAVQAAISFFETHFTNNITVNINFGWGEVAGQPIGGGDSGTSSTASDNFTYSDVLGALQATDTTSAVQQAAVASLPATDPTSGGTFSVAFAEELSLGLSGNATSSTNDGSVGLNSSASENWVWTQNGAYGASSDDAVGTLEHEISEVLGRSDNGGVGNSYTPLDLFRYTAANGQSTDSSGAAAGARDEPFVMGYSAQAPSYFSYNGQTVTLLYETPTDVQGGADIADWAPSVGFDSFADGPPGAASPVSATDLEEMNVLGYDLVCYASGTRILTVNGEVAVERLAVGDLVVTAAGERRPIRWLGHRRVDLRRHPRPYDVMPIRIAAHAFGANKPARDLFVSPGHAIAVDVVEQVLTPAYALVNGATIQQIDADEVTFWHVELDSHDLLVAENLPAESYLDLDNRAFFAEGGIVDLAAGPDPVRRGEFCRPFHERGAIVEAVRAQLRRRAEMLGWTLRRDPLADLHLMVDGVRINPTVRDLRARFHVPAGARQVSLMSQVSRPCDVEGGPDLRSLGVSVAGLSIEDGFAPPRAIALDDPALDEGFHDVERAGDSAWRWTRGRALLPPSLWAERAESFFLRIDLASDAPARWAPPLAAEPASEPGFREAA